MAEMNSALLRNLLITTKDGDWGKGEPVDGHTPVHVIRGTDFSDVRAGKSESVPLRYLSDKTIGRRTLEPNDILIETAGGSRDRPTGRTLLITQNILNLFFGPVTCASFARFLRVNPKLANPGYVYWYLQNLYNSGGMWVHQIQHTGVARFQYTRFAETEEIPLPSIYQQEAVTAVLGALDDKITVNERIAATSDELLMASFAGALSAFSERFNEKPLSQVAEFVNGRAFTKDATGRGRMVIRIAEINSGPGPSTVYNEIDVPDRHLARPGDVLFAWSGSLTVARWYRPEAIINQHIFKVIPKTGTPLWLAFELVRLKLTEFRGIAADKATTMGHIQRRHLDEPVQVPTAELLSLLDAKLGPLWGRALAAEQESLLLAALRDTLLPQLMSGRLRVRDAERIVEDAL
ncbi:hypothetical protein [Streptosporangium sp. NPDC087985]|uniref:hypothetical protein n=1 Tax=Streptosporangium sp. NPDC087985 TaxID=3366196 RepID=UPI0037F4D865